MPTTAKGPGRPKLKAGQRTEMVGTRLPAKMARAIKRLARRRKQSVSRRVRELIAAGLAAEGER